MERQLTLPAAASKTLAALSIMILASIGTSCIRYNRITRVYEGEQLPRDEIAVLYVKQVDDRVPYSPNGAFDVYYKVNRETFNKRGDNSLELLPGKHTVVARWEHSDVGALADFRFDFEGEAGREYFIGWVTGGKRWKPETLSEWVLPRFSSKSGRHVSLFMGLKESVLLIVKCPKCGWETYSFAVKGRPSAIRCRGSSKNLFKTYCDTWIPVPSSSEVPSADVWWATAKSLLGK